MKPRAKLKPARVRRRVRRMSARFRWYVFLRDHRGKIGAYATLVQPPKRSSTAPGERAAVFVLGKTPFLVLYSVN